MTVDHSCPSPAMLYLTKYKFLLIYIYVLLIPKMFFFKYQEVDTC